eukprot:scaffold35227_cov28-Tisochrysis_lutea.AAC.1
MKRLQAACAAANVQLILLPSGQAMLYASRAQPALQQKAHHQTLQAHMRVCACARVCACGSVCERARARVLLTQKHLTSMYADVPVHATLAAEFWLPAHHHAALAPEPAPAMQPPLPAAAAAACAA